MAVHSLLVDQHSAADAVKRPTAAQIEQPSALGDIHPTLSSDSEGGTALPQPLPVRAQPWRICAAMSSAGLYGATAIAMNFVNKAALMHFSLANSVLLLQMLAAVAIVQPLRWAGVLHFPAVSVAKARRLAPVTILYTANVCFALLGLSNLNIPMYNALKRLTPVMVLAVKASLQRKAPPQDITASVVLVVAGCLIAGIGDFTFDLKGYACALMSCGLQTGYLLLVERTGAEKGVGTSELLFYNALLSIPFLLAIVVGSGEVVKIWPMAAHAAAETGALHFALLLGSCAVMGVLLNFSLFLCTMHNSALTTTIVGVFKGVLATGLGFFLLGGVEAHVLNVTGILVNMAGGAWYSVIKFRQKAARSGATNPRPQGGALPRYAAISTQDDDAPSSRQRQPSSSPSDSGSFQGFPQAGGELSPVQSWHHLGHDQMRLQVQRPPGPNQAADAVIGGAAAGFSPRRLQNPWDVSGGELENNAIELAAGGLTEATTLHSPNRSRRNSYA